MVRITRTEHELGVEVHDDGIGFDPAAAEGDGGLAGLADRIAALGGAFAVKSEPGAGTWVRATLPARERSLA